METIEKDLEVKKATTTRLSSTAKHWIDGEWVDAEQHGTSVDPATGEPIGRYADGGQVEAEKAVAAALRVFQETSWRHDHALRSQVLLAMADQIEARSEDLIQILSAENGKIVVEARMEVLAAPALLRYGQGKHLPQGVREKPGLAAFPLPCVNR